MQSTRALAPSNALPSFWLLLSLSVALAAPIKTANYDFRHFSDDEGLTISFSKSSPPLAALEDERLPVVTLEPAQEIKADKNTEVIAAGTKLAWPRLKRYAKFFEQKQWRLKAAQKYVRHSPRKPFSREPVKFHATNGISTNEIRKLAIISELTKLVVAVPVEGPKKTVLAHVEATFKKSGPKASPRLLAANIINKSSPETVRDMVEAPLMAPSVERSLPRGEEILPSNEVEPSAPSPKFEVIVNPSGDDADKDKLNASSDDSDSDKSTTTALALPPAPTGQWRMAQQPTGLELRQVGETVTRTEPSPRDPRSLKPNDVVVPEDVVVNSANRIMGQVELAGGLAVTGRGTKMNIQWITGNQTRDALVDYSTGQFVVDVPTLQAGKLLATLVDDSNRTLGRGEFDLTDAAAPQQKLLEGVKIVVEPQNTSIRGQVYSAYSFGEHLIPVKDVELFAPASVREVADKSGRFQLSTLSSDSTFVLDTYAPEHWGTRVMVEGNRRPRIPMFTQKMLQSFFDLIGQPANNTEYGVVWGAVKHKGKPVKGVKVTLTAPDSLGPVYFNELLIPDKKLTETSSNGMYAFVKVVPGLHVVRAEINQRELPSSVVSVAPTMISYTEIFYKRAHLVGRVYDPIAQRNIQAQLNVVGTSFAASSGAQGFDFQVPSSDPVIFIEAGAGSDYYASRVAVPRSQSKEIDIFAFKKEWLRHQLNDLDIHVDEARGILIGYLNGPAFHVTLDGEGSDYSDVNTLYFDANGKIEHGRIEGVAGGGGFIMPNLKPGMHTLLVTSAEGEMTASRLFVSDAGAVNVINMSLRP